MLPSLGRVSLQVTLVLGPLVIKQHLPPPEHCCLDSNCREDKTPMRADVGKLIATSERILDKSLYEKRKLIAGFGPDWKHLATDKKPHGHSKDLIWHVLCGRGLGEMRAKLVQLQDWACVGGECGGIFSQAGVCGGVCLQTPN